MKYFLLFGLLTVMVAPSIGQIIYTTSGSGNYTQNSTWAGGSVGKPPTSGNCNCTIRILEGHAVTLNTTVNLSNANFVLVGANSQLLFSGTNDLNLTGNSTIDVQNANARIFSNNSGNIITLGTSSPGTIIFTGNETMVNSTTPGTVMGPASASSQREDPRFTNAALPVKLSDFQLSNEANRVVLKWATDQEINSDKFEIQRSGDGKSWYSIGSVKASGNADVSKSYLFTDATPLNGTNYYRLKMIDLDTKFEFSIVKMVNISVPFQVSTTPNPANFVLNITINQPGTGNYRIKLINRTGQTVHDQKFTDGNTRLSLSVINYHEGSYFLEVSDDKGFRQVNKVVILRKN